MTCDKVEYSHALFSIRLRIGIFPNKMLRLLRLGRRLGGIT